MSNESRGDLRGNLARVGRWMWAPATLALLLGVTRYLMQSPRGLYTEFERRFYIEGSLAWVETQESWVWLGADTLGVLVALAVGTGLVAWWGSRTLKADGASVLKQRLAMGLVIGGLLAGVGAIGLPMMAMSSGLPPEGAQAEPPKLKGASADAREGQGFKGGEAGTYAVIDHELSRATAKIFAGGTDFVATFKPGGAVTFDPKQILGGETKVELWIESGSIKTGNETRDDHAAGYLESEANPKIGLSLKSIESLKVEPSGALAFIEASVELTIMGAKLDRMITGQLQALDEAGRKEAGLGARAGYLLQAEFEIDLTKTPLAKLREEKAFDQDKIALQISLLLGKQ